MEKAFGCKGTDCVCAATDWFSVHCYHCGRRFEDIVIDGPTIGCLCDPKSDEREGVEEVTVTDWEE